MSLLVLATAGTTPIGAPIMGYVSAHWGARSALALGGIATGVAACVVAGWLRSRERADGQAPDGLPVGVRTAE
jgi:MFS family permease